MPTCCARSPSTFTSRSSSTARRASTRCSPNRSFRADANRRAAAPCAAHATLRTERTRHDATRLTNPARHPPVLTDRLVIRPDRTATRFRAAAQTFSNRATFAQPPSAGMRLALIGRRRCEYATRENRYVDDRGGVLDDGGSCRSRARPRAGADAGDDVRCAQDSEYQHALDEPWTGDEADENDEVGDDHHIHVSRPVPA